MFTDREYIVYSLQNALIAARIAYDHIIFLEITAPDYAEKLAKSKKNYIEFLNYTLDLANYKVDQNFIDSNIIVTKYTKELELSTSKIFKVGIDEGITTKSLELKAGEFLITDELLDKIKQLNNWLYRLLNDSIDNLNTLSEGVENKHYDMYCDFNYIDHYIDETEMFIYKLNTISMYSSGTPTFAYTSEYYYNLVMQQHCRFINNNFLKSSLELIKENKEFLDEFDENMLVFTKEISPSTIDMINLKTMLIVERYKHFEEDVIKSFFLDPTFYQMISPLYHDHLLREVDLIIFDLNALSEVSKQG